MIPLVFYKSTEAISMLIIRIILVITIKFNFI